MKAQFTLAVVAALASLVAAAPQRTEAVHKTARLRMTTINGDILDQLVNTGGDGRGQGARRTRSSTFPFRSIPLFFFSSARRY